jgi:hypothetical protein
MQHAARWSSPNFKALVTICILYCQPCTRTLVLYANNLSRVVSCVKYKCRSVDTAVDLSLRSSPHQQPGWSAAMLWSLQCAIRSTYRQSAPHLHLLQQQHAYLLQHCTTQQHSEQSLPGLTRLDHADRTFSSSIPSSSAGKATGSAAARAAVAAGAASPTGATGSTAKEAETPLLHAIRNRIMVRLKLYIKNSVDTSRYEHVLGSKPAPFANAQLSIHAPPPGPHSAHAAAHFASLVQSRPRAAHLPRPLVQLGNRHTRLHGKCCCVAHAKPVENPSLQENFISWAPF